MVSHREKLMSDVTGRPDDVEYKVFFQLQDEGESGLFETLHTSSPPELPDVGETLNFRFLRDQSGNEVRRYDGYVDERSIGSEYEQVHTDRDFVVADVGTMYDKKVSKEKQNTTIIEKVVVIQPE